MPNSAFVLGGVYYAVEATRDLITPIAYRSVDGSGNLTACTAQTFPLDSYPRLRVLATRTLPLTLSSGTFKIIRQ